MKLVTVMSSQNQEMINAISRVTRLLILLSIIYMLQRYRVEFQTHLRIRDNCRSLVQKKED